MVSEGWVVVVVPRPVIDGAWSLLGPLAAIPAKLPVLALSATLGSVSGANSATMSKGSEVESKQRLDWGGERDV